MKNAIKSRLKKGSVIYTFCSHVLHFFQNLKCLTWDRMLFEAGAFCRYAGLSRKYRKIAEYKDIYKGHNKRAFIVLTGPSLNMDDLEKLNNEITFSVNGIFQIYNKTNWRPTYYALLDIFVYRRFTNNNMNFDFDNIAKEQAFLDGSFENDVKNNNESLKKITFVPIYRYNHYVNGESRHFGFSKNLLRGHFSTWTVANFAINIAIYMGIKEIYLLGADCSYTGKNKYIKGVTDPKVMTDDIAYRTQQKMFDSYKYLKKRVEPLGVKIFNATRGGELEIFERCNFDSLFEMEDLK